MVWKVASLDRGKSGKLSLETDSLESCGREKDVAPFRLLRIFLRFYHKFVSGILVTTPSLSELLIRLIHVLSGLQIFLTGKEQEG
jgi:hypothetical protein